MSNTPIQKIGILGGMGAAASADFYQHLVKECQRTYHAEQDYDFPAMMLYNLPLVGFDETGFVDVAQVKNQLVAGVEKLAQSGSDFIVIPCNTVHYLYDEMQAATDTPILSIIEVTTRAASRAGHSRVGLLSSQSTKKYRIYEEVFAKYDIDTITVTDDEQKILNGVIAHVISGTQDGSNTEKLNAIIARLINEGAEAICIGCTELPLALEHVTANVPLLNSTALLAEATLRIAYGDDSVRRDG